METKHTTKPLLAVSTTPGDRRKKWCGPAAVSAVTGCSLHDILDDIAALRAIDRPRDRKHAVTGTQEHELQHALRQRGYLMWAHMTYDSEALPTLARWFRERQPSQRNWTFLVEVTRHWLVVRGNLIVDSKCLSPTRIGAYPSRRRRVHKVHVIREAENAPRRRAVRRPEAPERGVYQLP